MRELSLFTGAGGGLLATHYLLGWHSIGYVEWDGYCQKVVAQRIQDGLLTEAPIFNDVREFVQSGAARAYRGFTDVVTAGFPCQPFSVAGKQDASDDERNMWPATLDVIKEVQPRYAFLENVPGLLSSGTWDVDGAAAIPVRGYFGRVLKDLAEIGFDAEWGVLGASDVGGYHKRNRVWIVASNTKGEPGYVRGSEATVNKKQSKSKLGDIAFKDAANTSRTGREELHTPALAARAGHCAGSNTSLDEDKQSGPVTGADIPEPVICGVANDVAHRVDRVKATGNGQVPLTAAVAWTVLRERLETA